MSLADRWGASSRGRKRGDVYVEGNEVWRVVRLENGFQHDTLMARCATAALARRVARLIRGAEVRR